MLSHFALGNVMQITQTKALKIPHILREPNSIIVLLFICIYIELRVNACIVNKNTQATKPFVFPLLV